MPRPLAPPSLQSCCLHSFASTVSRALSQPTNDSQMAELELYIQSTVPKTRRQLVADVLCWDREPLPKGPPEGTSSSNGTRTRTPLLEECSASQRVPSIRRHRPDVPTVAAHNRMRLARRLGQADLVLDYGNARAAFDLLLDYNFSEYTQLVVVLETRIPCVLHCLTNHLCTMAMVTYLSIDVCDNNILRAVSRSCPNLETFVLSRRGEFDDAGVTRFCGFDPNHVKNFEDVRGFFHKSKNQCKKIRRLSFPGSFHLCKDHAAMILRLFSALEIFDFYGDYTFLDVLVVIYGENPSRYQHITHTFPVTRVRMTTCVSGTSDNFSLLTLTCPLITTLSLMFCGTERFDKNLLADLLPLQHLSEMELRNAHMGACLWFLEQKGAGLRSLSIRQSSPNEMRGANTWRQFTRLHFVQFSEYCPNLEDLSLELFEFGSVSDGMVAPKLKTAVPFQKLSCVFLKVSGNAYVLNVYDVEFLLSSKSLKSFAIRGSSPLNSCDLNTLLSFPFFRWGTIFAPGCCIAGTEQIDSLLAAAPELAYTTLTYADPEDTRYLAAVIKSYNLDLRDVSCLPNKRRYQDCSGQCWPDGPEGQ